MKINRKTFRVREAANVDLADWPTRVDPIYGSAAEYKDLLAHDVARLSDLQQRLYASCKHAILIVFQAMDTAGKDGAIRHVMSGINPQGCTVTSFKRPTTLESQHDFLWRATRELPPRGHIGIFNRSYYEDVLIARVHPELVGPAPAKTIWADRYRSINDLERHLTTNATRIIKIYLHLSKAEQRNRLLARIDEPEKNWKFDDADLKERTFWDDYMKAYGHCLAATSTKEAPWHVVPADDKENARLIVARIVVDTLETLDLAYPEVSEARRQELLALRAQLLG